MRALVTGTSGYLGSKIAEHLRVKGWAVVEISGRALFPDKARAAFLGQKFDLIVHAGFKVDFTVAPFDESERSENFLNTKLLLQLAEESNSGQFIFLGAAGVLGVAMTSSTILYEENMGEAPPPFRDWLRTHYLQEKIACEKFLEGAERIPVLSLLLTTTYGRNMQSHVVRSLRKFGQGFFPKLIPPGGTSFLHLDDFLAALDISIKIKLRGRFTVSSGNTSFHNLARTAAGKATLLVPLPQALFQALLWVNQKTQGKVPGILALSSFGYKYYSPGLFMRATGWAPKRSLSEALRAALGN